MYQKSSITFTVTFKDAPVLKPLIRAMNYLGRGYKKQLVEQLILKAAIKVADDPSVLRKLCDGKFDIVVK